MFFEFFHCLHLKQCIKFHEVSISLMWEQWSLSLVSMEVWVIFVVWFLINCMVKVHKYLREFYFHQITLKNMSNLWMVGSTELPKTFFVVFHACWRLSSGDQNILRKPPNTVNSGGYKISQTRRGAPTPKVGVPNYYLANFFQKTAWKWKKLDPEVAGVPGAPLRFANDQWSNSHQLDVHSSLVA